VLLYLRTSTNNGSSFDSGASDYAWNLIESNAGGIAAEGDSADSQIILAGSSDDELGTGSNEIFSGRLWIFKPSASDYTKICSIGSYTDQKVYQVTTNTGGARLSTTAVNAIQLLMSSGNIATGNFRLYGFKA